MKSAKKDPSELDMGFDMGMPPPYASKESTYVSQHESSTDPDEIASETRYVRVEEIDDGTKIEEETNIDSFIVSKPQMRPENPTPESGQGE